MHKACVCVGCLLLFSTTYSSAQPKTLEHQCTAYILKQIMKNPNFKKSPEFQGEVDRLMEVAIGTGSKAEAARKKVQALLGLDDVNWAYYHALFERNAHAKASGSGTQAPLRIFEEGQPTAGQAVVYPTSIAPKPILKHLRMSQYADLQNSGDAYSASAKNSSLWIKKMQAGSGSSLTRSSYISKQIGIPEASVKIGAKGTDLLVSVPHPVTGKTVQIPLVEAQLLQSILDQKRGMFGDVIFHDIVSSETAESIKKIWKKPSLLDPNKTYEQLVSETPGLQRFNETMQAYVPALDESGKISFEHQAPGGHALFAVEALRAAYKPELRPKVGGKSLIAAISNGEDISGTPDNLMVGWMVKEKIPIALVTTEKTVVDGKGGVISLVKDAKDDISLTVLETAQAEAAGQKKLFEKLRGSASTNLTLFNYDVLAPKIQKLVDEIGEDEFMKIISPDLIRNVKEKKTAAGAVQKFVQLEGAMGSTIMNLDRFWRKHYGEPLVHLLNVDVNRRTEFFSPIKSAFDYFMQFHSDRFAFDPSRMRLQNLRPGKLPTFVLNDAASGDKYYKDVQNVLDSFKGSSIADMDSISVDGKVNFAGAIIKGNVEIVNHGASIVDLSKVVPKQNGKIVLENTRIEIDANGKASIKSLK